MPENTSTRIGWAQQQGKQELMGNKIMQNVVFKIIERSFG